jgi:hypothetical protein
MLTGEIRNQIDRVWDVFWTGVISTPSKANRRRGYL